MTQCSFGISHDAYRKALVIINEPNTPSNQKKLTVNADYNRNRRLASVSPGETLGQDSPDAKYSVPSSLKERQIRFGRRDYKQASFLYEL